jgi:hypothetical protein
MPSTAGPLDRDRWPWSGLNRQAALIDSLRSVVLDGDEWRWLEVCCSLAAGRGDDLSDVDAGIGYVSPIDADSIEAAGLSVVHGCGAVIDALVHLMPDWPPETRRFAVEFATGVQLDLVVMPAGRRTGLPTGAIAVVDKDGHLSQPWSPPAEDAPTAATAREWLMLGWWALSDVAKYLRRGSLFEAVDRMVEARQQALRLHAVARGVPFPSFGLVSLLDFPPFEVPDRLADTYAVPASPTEVLARARSIADLLDASARAAGRALGTELTTPWAACARARFAAALATP